MIFPPNVLGGSQTIIRELSTLGPRRFMYKPSHSQVPEETHAVNWLINEKNSILNIIKAIGEPPPSGFHGVLRSPAADNVK